MLIQITEYEQQDWITISKPTGNSVNPTTTRVNMSTMDRIKGHRLTVVVPVVIIFQWRRITHYTKGLNGPNLLGESV